MLGPLLWNILYDGLLRLQFPEGVDVLAYADDLALLVRERTAQSVAHLATRAAKFVCDWMSEVGLEIAPQKTECVMLVGARTVGGLQIAVDGRSVEIGRSLKYLGVMFGAGGSFSPHIRYLTTRVEKQIMMLSRLMPNWSLIGQTKRRLLAAAFSSTVLYAAEAWGEAMHIRRNVVLLTAAQKRLALRVCRGYRTVSADAAQVISSLIPIDLLIEERRTRWKRETVTAEESREITMEQWCSRWEPGEGKTAKWTRLLIQDLKSWYGRSHGEVTFTLTQVLSGHGCFRHYLYIRKLSACAGCIYGDAEDDTAKHTVMECKRWSREREEVRWGCDG